MRRSLFARTTEKRWLVLKDMQHTVLSVRELDGRLDLYVQMVAEVEGLRETGWTVEGTIEFGFTFVNRDGERRLLALTERDPADQSRQAFSPH